MRLLPRFEVRHFVNADNVAAGLSPLNPASAAVAAGRIVLQRYEDLTRKRESFAVESTLSSRRIPAFLMQRAHDEDFHVHLVFVWIPSAGMSVARVATRVAAGGHDIPLEDMRRRYEKTLRNLVQVYIPLADSWVILDNSTAEPTTIAYGSRQQAEVINGELFDQIQRTAQEGSGE